MVGFGDCFRLMGGAMEEEMRNGMIWISDFGLWMKLKEEKKSVYIYGGFTLQK